jgi:hypothetical protein
MHVSVYVCVCGCVCFIVCDIETLTMRQPRSDLVVANIKIGIWLIQISACCLFDIVY